MAKKTATKKPKQSKKKPAPKKEYATIGRAAAHCGVSDTTFRSFMIRHPDMPIEKRSVRNGGYEIDLDLLDKYREKNDVLNWTPVAPVLPAGQNPSKSSWSKDKKAQIQTELLQIELDEKLARLVPSEDVIKYFSTKMAQLAKKIDLFPAMLGCRLGFEPDVIEEVRKFSDEWRIAVVADNEGFFTVKE